MDMNSFSSTRILNYKHRYNPTYHNECSTEQMFDSGVSKEDNSFLRLTSSTRKVIKHSTPVDATLSKSMVSIESISYLKETGSEKGNLLESSLPKTPFLELSTHPDTRSLKPIGQRKRLSTVSASEESNEEVQTSLNLSAVKLGHKSPHQLTKKSSKMSFRKWECYGLPGIKDPAERKGYLKKKHVANDVRQWELRQLKNIEEAIHHELIVEVTQ